MVQVVRVLIKGRNFLSGERVSNIEGILGKGEKNNIKVIKNGQNVNNTGAK